MLITINTKNSRPLVCKAVGYWVLTENQRRQTQSVPTKAFQVRIGDNKTVVVYGRIQGYILDALLKAVFNDAH